MKRVREVLPTNLDHAKHQAVSFSHAFGVWRIDIFLDNLLPASPTQPAAKETLYLSKEISLARRHMKMEQTWRRRTKLLFLFSSIRPYPAPERTDC